MEYNPAHLFKKFNISTTTQYKEWKQWIIGITLNKETETFSSQSISSESYEESCFELNKYEFNVWLVLIGIHITLRGKAKKTQLYIK